jgi:GNAT superfamily N-acetyltransferase
MRLIEIADANSNMFLDFVEAWERAFPCATRDPASVLIRIAQQEPAARAGQGKHLVVAADDQVGAFVGGAVWEELSVEGLAVTYLWYLFVEPQLRSQGLGTDFYCRIRDAGRASRPGSVLVFEVEDPTSAVDVSAARRRIAFYRRLGARCLWGVRYVAAPAGHGPVAWLPMVDGDIGASTALGVFRSLGGDEITEIGDLSLE